MHNYSFQVAWSSEDAAYVATSLEFPGLSGLADSPEDALRELRKVVEVAVEAYVEDGDAVPQPIEVQEFSGQFRLRLPKSLHAALAGRAVAEGVSLNALAQTLISAGLSQMEFARQLEKHIEPLRECIRAIPSLGTRNLHLAKKARELGANYISALTNRYLVEPMAYRSHLGATQEREDVTREWRVMLLEGRQSFNAPRNSPTASVFGDVQSGQFKRGGSSRYGS